MNQGSGGILLKGLRDDRVQVPVALLEAQATLGLEAAMLWIHLAAAAAKGQSVTMQQMAEDMGLERGRVETALAALADRGWINDEGMEIRLSVPEGHSAEDHLKRIEQSSPVKGHQRASAILDPNQAQFEWLVDFWNHRIGKTDSDVMRRLVFWTEQKGMSHEAIAVAIEEMCSSAPRPSLAYLEGVLRNWYQEGVRDYQDLLDRPRLAKVLPTQQKREEGVDSGAQRKWKELFPDEFDQ